MRMHLVVNSGEMHSIQVWLQNFILSQKNFFDRQKEKIAKFTFNLH